MTRITTLFPAFDRMLTVNEKKLARELDLVRRAREDGARNFPPADREEPTELEIAILARAQHAIEEARQWLKRRFALRAETVEALRPTPDERDVEAQVEAAEFDLPKLRDERKETLILHAGDEAAARRELNKFRRDAGLTREAKYWKSESLLYAVAFALILGEAVLNANVLASASDGGLIAGWLTALLYSGVNWVLAFVLLGAVGLRYALHARLALRAAGLLVSMVAAGAILGYNGYLGTVRAAIAENPDAPAYRLAIGRMLREPFAFLATPEATQLFAIGLCMALIFAIKGFVAYDPYPGYRKADRAYRKAGARLEAAKIAFRDAAQRLMNARVTKITSNLAAAEKRHREAIRQINLAEVDATTAETAAIDSAAACRRLVALYRTENAAVRTEPAPAYFPTLPNFEDGLRGLPENDFARDRGARIEELTTFREDAMGAKRRLREMAMSALDMVKLTVAEAAQDAVDRAEQDGGPHLRSRFISSPLAAE